MAPSIHLRSLKECQQNAQLSQLRELIQILVNLHQHPSVLERVKPKLVKLKKFTSQYTESKAIEKTVSLLPFVIGFNYMVLDELLTQLLEGTGPPSTSLVSGTLDVCNQVAFGLDDIDVYDTLLYMSRELYSRVYVSNTPVEDTKTQFCCPFCIMQAATSGCGRLEHICHYKYVVDPNEHYTATTTRDRDYTSVNSMSNMRHFTYNRMCIHILDNCGNTQYDQM